MEKFKLYFKIFIYYIIFFPAIFMHEMAHLLAAIITFSNIHKISFIPQASGNNVVLAYVNSEPRIKALGAIVSLAPISLWYLLYLFLNKFGFLNIELKDSLYIYFDYKSFFDVKNSLIIYIAIQLYSGGFPSKQDIKIMVSSLFSFSGFILLAILFFIYTGIKNGYIAI